MEGLCVGVPINTTLLCFIQEKLEHNSGIWRFDSIYLLFTFLPLLDNVKGWRRRRNF